MSIIEHLVENYIHEMGRGKNKDEIAELPYIKKQLEDTVMSADVMWEIAQEVVYGLYDGFFPDFSDLPEETRKIELFGNSEQLPSCEDSVSRQAAIDAMCFACGNDCDKSKFVYNAPQDEQAIMCPEHYALTQLPSVQQKRKEAEWILLDDCSNAGYYCSNCRKKVVREGWSKTVKKIKYCPNCGFRMEGGIKKT